MAVNTLQIANRLKAAERDGRLPEELAQIFGRFSKRAKLARRSASASRTRSLGCEQRSRRCGRSIADRVSRTTYIPPI
jgi:hypothetical protein